MAKNKILGWRGALQGIKDFAAIALQSLRNTSLEAIKAMAAEKSIIVKPMPEKPTDVQSYAKDMGLEAIQKMKLPEPVFPKKTEGQLKPEWTEGQLKPEWTDGGIFSKALVRKPETKKQ